MHRLNKNIKLLFKYFLVPLLAGWLFYSLYRQIQNQPGLADSWAVMKTIPSGTNAWLFWLTVALVFCNWGLESMKWQLLIRPLEKMTFGRAFKSVLSGVALSINTPNRIGEYGGRMLYVQEGNKLKSISLSIAGSISQLLITLLCGCAGLLYLIRKVLPMEGSIIGLSAFWVEVLFVISLLAALALALFFFKMSWLVRVIERSPVITRVAPYIRALEQFDTKLLLSLLALSFFRYIVFILQYLLLWQALELNIGWQSGVLLVSVLFLVMAIVPSFAIADLGIRGQFSVALLGSYSSNTVGIIGATFGIWVLNLFLPALVGSIMILGVKFFKEKKN